jgi:hypothetical protein
VSCIISQREPGKSDVQLSGVLLTPIGFFFLVFLQQDYYLLTETKAAFTTWPIITCRTTTCTHVLTIVQPLTIT